MGTLWQPHPTQDQTMRSKGFRIDPRIYAAATRAPATSRELWMFIFYLYNKMVYRKTDPCLISLHFFVKMNVLFECPQKVNPLRVACSFWESQGLWFFQQCSASKGTTSFCSCPWSFKKLSQQNQSAQPCRFCLDYKLEAVGKGNFHKLHQYFRIQSQDKINIPKGNKARDTLET